MTLETQIPSSTPEGRTGIFDKLDLETPHNKVEKKGEEKKKMAWRTEHGDKNLIFIL